jgi:hypothetical protein
VEAGTWFLSYLSSCGYVYQDDDIFDGELSGTVLKTFADIPVGSIVRITMSSTTWMDVIYRTPEQAVLYAEACRAGEVEGCEDLDNFWWYYRDFYHHEKVRVSINFVTAR